MKMKKVLENQGLFLAEKERFELSRRYSRPTPLAGAPLRPLEYFSVYSSPAAGCIGLRHPILYMVFPSLSSPFLQKFFYFLRKVFKTVRMEWLLGCGALRATSGLSYGMPLISLGDAEEVMLFCGAPPDVIPSA